MSFASRYLTCEGREIHFTERGAGHAETVIAWHGLARTCRDMDDIAEHLSARYRVICPDTIGRGLSQWSPDPAREYCLDFYARIALDLITQLGLTEMHWLGTSMGGAIGTVLASGALRGRIRRLILNDNGPSLAPAALQRIRDYAGSPPSFLTLTELEAYFREIYASFGWVSDAQWRRLTQSSARRLPDGRVTPHYDPAIVQQFIHWPNDYERWDDYDRIDVPTLCLRGEASTLLLPETAEAMRSRGPNAIVVTIAGCGHAPALNVPEQFDLVERFLNAGRL
jgi:pimeloyl-ACP methyl ester carboxylesterase